jgi:hypothetical protein
MNEHPSDGSKDTPSAHQRHQDIPLSLSSWTLLPSAVFYPKEIINMTIRMTQSAILMLALIGSGAFIQSILCASSDSFRLASKNLSPTRDVTCRRCRSLSRFRTLHYRTLVVHLFT